MMRLQPILRLYGGVSGVFRPCLLSPRSGGARLRADGLFRVPQAGSGPNGSGGGVMSAAVLSVWRRASRYVRKVQCIFTTQRVQNGDRIFFDVDEILEGESEHFRNAPYWISRVFLMLGDDEIQFLVDQVKSEVILVFKLGNIISAAPKLLPFTVEAETCVAPSTELTPIEWGDGLFFIRLPFLDISGDPEFVGCFHEDKRDLFNVLAQFVEEVSKRQSNRMRHNCPMVVAVPTDLPDGDKIGAYHAGSSSKKPAEFPKELRDRAIGAGYENHDRNGQPHNGEAQKADLLNRFFFHAPIVEQRRHRNQPVDVARAA